MSKYKSQLLQRYEKQKDGCVEFLDVFDPWKREAVDFNDFPSVTEGVHAMCDDCKGIKYLDTIESFDLETDRHTMKNLIELSEAPNLHNLCLTFKMSEDDKDIEEFLNDMKEIQKVKTDVFVVFLNANEHMNWQTERQTLLKILPRLPLPYITTLCKINIGSNRLLYLTKKEYDDEDFLLSQEVENAIDIHRTVGGDCLKEL